jgi:YHS domain-containing protein
MFARVLLYAIIGLIVLQILRSLFRTRLPRGQARSRESRGGPTEELLVRDPQCGIYLPREAGIRRTVRGEDHYFCSKTCLEAFQAGRDV